MADPMFKIVYCGDVAAGHDVETVKTNLQKLTGYGADRIESLFTGRKVVIKSGIDEETAGRYMAALAGAGAVCYCLPVSVTPAGPPPNLSVPEPAESDVAYAESGTLLLVLNSIPRPVLYGLGVAIPLILLLFNSPEFRKSITRSAGTTEQAATATTSRLVSVVAGSPGYYGLTDGQGSAARFGRPAGMASDGKNLYVADPHYRNIRAISLSTGTVTTLAGNTDLKGTSGIVDGQGAAARFNQLDHLATDGSYVYVLEGNLLRKIEINTGNVTSVPTAFAATDPLKGDPAGQLELRAVNGIATDGRYLYAAGNASIRKIDIFTGETVIFAGSCAKNAAPADGVGAAAAFRWPTAIASDGAYLYVLDASGIRKVSVATGEVGTLKAGKISGRYLVTDGKYLYVSLGFLSGNAPIRVFETASGNEVKGAGCNEHFDAAAGMVIEGGKLYVAERGRNIVSAMPTSAFTGTP